MIFNASPIAGGATATVCNANLDVFAVGEDSLPYGLGALIFDASRIAGGGTATVCNANLDVFAVGEDSATVCNANLDVLGVAEDNAPYGLGALIFKNRKKLHNILSHF